MEQVLEKRSNLVLPKTGYELDRAEMSYVDGGGAIPVIAISIPINLLICLNPGTAVAFGGIVGMAKWGFKTAAKTALKPFVKNLLIALSHTIGIIYAGASTAITGISDSQMDQVVTAFFSCFGGLGSILGLAIDLCDGKMDGWLRW